ncbi:MAG: OmpH family outer membrane protein [Prevotella sp.]|nr:OmpH family outer membrane protein [Prevotella sp.]
MKHLFLILLLSATSLSSQAQVTTALPDTLPLHAVKAPSLRFGYFSYQAALQAMPDYAIARHNLDDLRTKYDNEMKRVESEFNKKYEEFLEGQKDFAPSILQKRQAELQDMMQKNMAFKQEAQRLLKQAEDDTFKPLKERLALAVHKVGRERALAFILNTDDNAVPYIDAAFGEDILSHIADALK